MPAPTVCGWWPAARWRRSRATSTNTGVASCPTAAARARLRRPAAPRRASRSDQRRAAAERRAELAPLRARITRAEATIERLTQEMARLDTALAQPDLYADPARAAGLAKARADAATALAAAEADWLDASTAYEAAMATESGT